MSNNQAKVLSFIKQHGGEVHIMDLQTHYRWRSIPALEDAGWIRVINCNTTPCQCTLGYQCPKAKVRLL